MNYRWWDVDIVIPAFQAKDGWTFNFGMGGTEFVKFELEHLWKGRLLTIEEIANWSEVNCDCDICKAKRVQN